MLDCIDNRDAKVGLMAYCKNNNIKVTSPLIFSSTLPPLPLLYLHLYPSLHPLTVFQIISAFGAGSAHDPTKINVCDLKDSFGCVFGKTIRRFLRPRYSFSPSSLLFLLLFPLLSSLHFLFLLSCLYVANSFH